MQIMTSTNKMTMYGVINKNQDYFIIINFVFQREHFAVCSKFKLQFQKHCLYIQQTRKLIQTYVSLDYKKVDALKKRPNVFKIVICDMITKSCPTL